MQTFAELLTEYMARTGVSDAELARAIGVQRQTIFRWKEGRVARPRAAEDVLCCAGKLRLAPEERDLLLVAAGFPPVNRPVEPFAPATLLAQQPAQMPVQAPVQAPAQEVMPAVRTIVVPLARGPRRLPAWAMIAAAAGTILIVAAAVLARRAAYPQARAGETLIVIGQFANYTGGAQGFNLAGRVQEALERELVADRAAQVRAATWPEVIRDAGEAERVVKRAGAALVIWGEYDSGRAVAHLTAAGRPGDAERLERLAVSPGDLSATINGELPEEVRYLALLTLGRMAAERSDYSRARAILEQAAARPPADPTALAGLDFLLGYSHQLDQPADLDQAIDFYTRALALRPEITAAHNNRGLAYLRRGRPEDIPRAVSDLTAVIEAAPDDAAALTNRGAAYLRLVGGDSLDRALADLERAVALAPDSVEARFNLGLVNVRRNERGAWQTDFARALVLNPDHVGAQEALCWAYALDNDPEAALPHCERAVALAPGGPGLDSRGIVYAELGRFDEAIADFEAHLANLREADPASATREEPHYQAWLAALATGRNPFDAPTRDQLRNEP